MNTDNKEQKLPTTDKAGVSFNPLLSAVLRPKMGSEALAELKKGNDIEIENSIVFEFLRYIEKAERNFRCTCSVNKINEGWTIIKHSRERGINATQRYKCLIISSVKKCVSKFF